jgi:hypothetical protein
LIINFKSGKEIMINYAEKEIIISFPEREVIISLISFYELP